VPKNSKPVGTISLRTNEGKNSYKYIKIAEPNKWVVYHRQIWQEANGPIPPGHVVIFKNGDQNDCRLENLDLITRMELRNRNFNYNTDKFIAGTMARVGHKIDKNLRENIMRMPSLMAIKRKQLKLRRVLDEQSRSGD